MLKERLERVMPRKATAAENLTDTLVNAYREDKEEAKVFDDLITKLEKRAAELRYEQDKRKVLLINEIEGLLKSAKILRDRCMEAARKEEEKDQEKKRALKSANLAAGYYLASLKMFQTLAREDPDNVIYKNQAKGAFNVEFNNLFDAYLTEWKRLTEERYKAFGKSIGIDAKDETVKTEVGEFEEWDKIKEEKETVPVVIPEPTVEVPVPKTEEDNDPDDDPDDEDELDEDEKNEIRRKIPGMGFGGSNIGF